jgi:hypothetical protein
MRRLAEISAALAVVVALSGAVAPQADAAYGDNFGIADVNCAGAPEAPAFAPEPGPPAPCGEKRPGTTAFWAGTCNTGSPPPFGRIPGGLGTRPDQVWAPSHPYGGATHEVPAPASPDQCIDFGRLQTQNVNPWVAGQGPAWRLAPVNQAGAHPDGTATMWFRRDAEGSPSDPDGSVDNIYVDLPAGFVGDPTVVPKCTADQFAVNPIQCPPSTQVGVLHLLLAGAPTGGGVANYGDLNEEILPIYNLEPRHGNVAELGFANASGEDVVTVRIVAKARTNGDFGVTAFAAQIPTALPLLGQAITLWGTPWSSAHDEWRPPQGFRGAHNWPATQTGPRGESFAGELPPGGLAPEFRVGYDSSWGAIKPFLSNPTECSGSSLSTQLATDSFEHQGAFGEGFPDLTDPDWQVYHSPAPPITGCEKVPFDPAASFVPSSTAPDSASGLHVDITIPPNDTPPAGVATNPSEATGAPAHWRSDAGLATSHLDKSVVTLPEGMSVNPSGATGLEGCSDAQIGLRQVGNPNLFDDSEPSCPEGSKIGTVQATTPVLEGSPNLTGDVILGAPKSTDPVSGEMLRMFLVLRNPERGLLAKIYGSAVADPSTGRLTATFDKNPRVPVENIKLELKGGARGLLAMPQSCGPRAIEALFSPWSAAHGAGGVARALSHQFTVAGDCSFRFAPTLDAGMSVERARAFGTFSFQFTRPEGQQWVSGLTAKLPKGLLASVKGVPLCGDAQAAAGNCPQASKIGVVDASAGSGSPLVLEEKGKVFLTRGYKGGAYGLMARIRAIAGPFRGAHELSPIVVRQALHVDRSTAQVTAVSDPLPLIHHGVPLRVRQVTVLVNRSKFSLNPSGCRRKRVVGTFTSAQGAQARRSVPFQAAGCARLPFKPKLALRLTGRKQTRTGRHPGIKATVTQKGVGEAGIRRAEVRLPKSLALDTDNAQALCEFEDGTKPDLERHCPKGSIVGRARAVSPLLDKPLAGNVYFVKNVRRAANGNLIRTLPMIIVALRGEIAVNLKGTSNVKQGKLVNTFAAVPDAPISRFNLNIRGGSSGIVAVTRTRRATIDVCRGKQIAEAYMDGHNGKRRDFNVRMKTPCKKKGRAKRGGAKRR